MTKLTKLVPLLIWLVLAADIGTGIRSTAAAGVCPALESLRQEVNAAPGGTTCGWTPMVNQGGCLQRPVGVCNDVTAAGITRDVLGRRASGRLAQPESQGTCGNCWAFASSHTFSDRLRLPDNSPHMDLVVSSEDVTTCIQETVPNLIGPAINTPNRIPNGCCGGMLGAAFQYFEEVGAVSSECKQYSVSLARYSKSQTPMLDCTTQCGNSMPFNRGALRQTLFSRREVRTEEEIIDELRNGPVLVNMRVPQDLRLYACGIYCHTRGDIGGSHQVELVDHGSENGIDYWVVKNSWGLGFGENGYFRIRRGERYFLRSGYGLAPVITETTDRADWRDTELSCSPVAADTSDDFVEDAAEYAVEMVVVDPSFVCSNGTNTGSGTVESVMAATTQAVAGTLFSLTIDAAISGCNDEAIIIANVMLDLDGTLELMPGYQYFPNGLPDSGGGSSHANTGLVLFISLCMLAFI